MKAVTGLLKGLLVAIMLMLSLSAKAEITTRELQIVARTLGFLETPMSGELSMGIVYDPGNTNSRQQAETIADQMEDGLRVGNLLLNPVLVSLSEATSTDVNFFLLTEFLVNSTASLPPVLVQRKLPCISTDFEQVRNGYCAIGVQASPKVEILVNRLVANNSDVRFSTVFRMMITEF